MTEVRGECDERFAAVRQTLEATLADGRDVGASACVVVDGEVVVDIWGGHADAERTVPWERDTIINVWSTTKTMTALCALILADRGEIDLDAPVADVWPEFKANGKEQVLVRHLLGHTAGLPSWTEPVDAELLYDWERACSLLADQAPWWEPGTASGYHAVTQGYLVGEVVRRASGKSLGTFFREEVAEPLGADFHIGTGPEHDDRCARVIPPPSLADQLAGADPESIALRALSNPNLQAEQSWEEAWRRAEIPAAGGHGNARSVATVQAAVSHGGEVFGTRLLSEAGAERIFEEQASGTDLVLGIPLTLGIGFGINSEETPLSPNPRTCFWGGWGGSLVVNDLDARMTVAYVMNRMGMGTVGDDRGIGVLLGAYQGLAAS